MKKSQKIFLLLILFFSIICTLYPVPCALIYADVPHLINYQGRLTDKTGKPVADGAHQIVFKIYDADNNQRWQGSYPITTAKGVFSVLLGSTTDEGFTLFKDLPFEQQYYLEMVYEGERMGERQLIASSAYAIRAENVDSLPKGMIALWSGSITAIPSGWTLCDGSKGTPDLRDKFIVGTGNNYAVGATGGEAAHVLTTAEMPAHTHSYGYNRVTVSGTDRTISEVTSGTTTTGSTGSGAAHNNLPPYYALAYIMKL
ncbi:MAG: hypothetical protein WC628_07635 [Candidatus Omnitrophota bacterium]